MVSTRADIITRRTYARPIVDGGTEFETWDDTCQRVIGHQAWLWERALTARACPEIPLHDLSEDMNEWVSLNYEQTEELQELYNLIHDRKLCPAGRTLWLGGTEVSKRREASMFNCSHTNIETVYDVVDAFWLLLQGCGVGFTPIVGTLTGFRKPIEEIEIIYSKRKGKGGNENNEEIYGEDNIWTIIVGDSAEAWAKSIGKLLAGKYEARKLIFDFSNIRPAGERLKGYGWISSGDDSIAIAYPAIANILSKRAGALLTKIDILDIMNWLGTVLSSRRSAEIALCEYGSAEWHEFATAKERCFEEEFKHRQQSNNSLVFYKKPTKEELIKLFDIIVRNGGSEPGLVNGETALKRAPWFKGLNPCAEILLSNKSFCNLVEVDVSKFYLDSSGLHRALILAARMNYRQTIVDFRDGILQESWHLNNEFLRLCGVGVTGIIQREDLSAESFHTPKLILSFPTARARLLASALASP
jgi:ribonucleoside-triphosphate reductase